MALVEAAAALVTTEIVAKLATKQITDKAAADVEAPQVIIKTPAFNAAVEKAEAAAAAVGDEDIENNNNTNHDTNNSISDVI